MAEKNKLFPVTSVHHGCGEMQLQYFCNNNLKLFTMPKGRYNMCTIFCVLMKNLFPFSFYFIFRRLKF